MEILWRIMLVAAWMWVGFPHANGHAGFRKNQYGAYFGV